MRWWIGTVTKRYNDNVNVLETRNGIGNQVREDKTWIEFTSNFPYVPYWWIVFCIFHLKRRIYYLLQWEEYEILYRISENFIVKIRTLTLHQREYNNSDIMLSFLHLISTAKVVAIGTYVTISAIFPFLEALLGAQRLQGIHDSI